MLVLSRKAGEKIAIGDQIEISIIQISPTTVRLGICAPQSCAIVRGELVLPPTSEIQEIVSSSEISPTEDVQENAASMEIPQSRHSDRN